MKKTRNKCRLCGKRKVKTKGDRVCLDCRLNRMNRNARQLKNHKGKFYEKWLEGIHKGIIKLVGE